MANQINYAESFNSNLITIYDQEALTSPFWTDSVKWTGAKTFHFTQMSTSGYKDTNRNNNSYNQGSIKQLDNEYTIDHERDVSLGIHPSDIDESNLTASIENIADTFTRTQDVPEADAYFFSRIATLAIENNLKQSTPKVQWTAENVYQKILNIINKPSLKIYRANGSLILYVASYIMDLLELSSDFKRIINMQTVGENANSVETRITSINGVHLIEVIDDNRFYTKFDFTDGFVADSDGAPINILAATPITSKFVKKYNKILYAEHDAHHPLDTVTFASFAGAVTFPNGKDNKIDSIFVDINAAA